MVGLTVGLIVGFEMGVAVGLLVAAEDKNSFEQVSESAAPVTGKEDAR